MADKQTAPAPSAPAAAPPPPPDPLSKKGAQIAHRLRGLFADTESGVSNRVLSSSYGTDTTLLIAQYTLHLLSSLPPSKSLSVRLPLLHRLTTTTKPRTLTLPLSFSPPTTTALKSLTTTLSTTRLALRLLGLPPLWTSLTKTLTSPPRDIVLRYIALTQAVLNLAYQVLENLAFLNSLGVLDLEAWGRRKRGEKAKVTGGAQSREMAAWLWSSRAWMLGTVLDFVRLYREKALRRAASVEKEAEKQTAEESHATPSASSLSSSPDSTNEIEKQEIAQQDAKWTSALLSNIFYAPLTVHWSVETGAVPEPIVGALGALAGVLAFRGLWAGT
ncbi:MAG: hypothetical protein M1819_000411 [Sarea resinae]|nr:MAG: hypothetical protein M1819_000411 [Sarea resinae]